MPHIHIHIGHIKLSKWVITRMLILFFNHSLADHVDFLFKHDTKVEATLNQSSSLFFTWCDWVFSFFRMPAYWSPTMPCSCHATMCCAYASAYRHRFSVERIFRNIIKLPKYNRNRNREKNKKQDIPADILRYLWSGFMSYRNVRNEKQQKKKNNRFLCAKNYTQSDRRPTERARTHSRRKREEKWQQ